MSALLTTVMLAAAALAAGEAIFRIMRAHGSRQRSDDTSADDVLAQSANVVQAATELRDAVSMLDLSLRKVVPR